VQPIESGLIGLEPISPELVLVDPELRAIVLRELQARFESNVEDNVLLPLRVVSPEAAVPPDAFGESPREVVRSWPRRLMQVAVVVAFGVGGYAVSAWTTGDVGHASAESIARATTTAVGRPPKASRTVAHRSRPKEVMTPPAAQAFVWVPVGRAAYYDVRFFRNGQLVFEAWPSEPRLQLPSRWVHAGHGRRLVPGRYAWRVFPVFGSRASPRLGAAIVRSTWITKR
jgi:hypothetical protein